MRLTESEIIKNKKPVIADNRTLLDCDCDCERYHYLLIIGTNTERSEHRVFKIMFNKDISTELYITLHEWIKACNVFDTKFDKVKYSMDVPLRVKDSQEMVNYLNDVFDTKDNKVLNIRWAVFYKD